MNPLQYYCPHVTGFLGKDERIIPTLLEPSIYFEMKFPPEFLTKDIRRVFSKPKLKEITRVRLLELEQSHGLDPRTFDFLVEMAEFIEGNEYWEEVLDGDDFPLMAALNMAGVLFATKWITEVDNMHDWIIAGGELWKTNMEQLGVKAGK